MERGTFTPFGLNLVNELFIDLL
uniref:Uncharacterized protein n=1 Tax=Arundo donax TaxID=35708 RepID=A0A0A8YKK1_ARUDO